MGTVADFAMDEITELLFRRVFALLEEMSVKDDIQQVRILCRALEYQLKALRMTILSNEINPAKVEIDPVKFEELHRKLVAETRYADMPVGEAIIRYLRVQPGSTATVHELALALKEGGARGHTKRVEELEVQIRKAAIARAELEFTPNQIDAPQSVVTLKSPA